MTKKNAEFLSMLFKQQADLAVEIDRAYRWSHCFAAMRAYLGRRYAYAQGFERGMDAGALGEQIRSRGL